MSIDAMKQALDALEYIYTETTEEEDKLIHAAITALRLAIEQAERQEPVAWLWQHSETGRTRIVMPDSVITADANWIVVGPLYLGAAPPQRQPRIECTRCGRILADVPPAGDTFAERWRNVTGAIKDLL